jgi:uncharacterized membrane protein
VNQNPEPLKFRIRHIILPLSVLVLTAVLAVLAFGRLPEDVYFRFGLDGAPSGDPAARGTFVAIMLAIQLGLVLLAWLTVRAIAGVRLFQENINSFWFEPAKLLTIMGNLPVIIQLILGYVLLDAVVYAGGENHLLPLWLFALIVLVVGGIVLLAYAVPVVLQAYKGFNKLKENNKE